MLKSGDLVQYEHKGSFSPFACVYFLNTVLQKVRVSDRILGNFISSKRNRGNYMILLLLCDSR